MEGLSKKKLRFFIEENQKASYQKPYPEFQYQVEKHKEPQVTVDVRLRNNGLGPFAKLPDHLISRIFRYLRERDLCALSMVSRAFYVYADDEEMWKRLCIRKKRGDFLFKGSWKLTTLMDRDQHLKHQYRRLVFDGVVSVRLYRRWYRSTVSLERWSKLEFQQIDRRSNLSLQEFIEEYDKKNKPVILTDVTDNWRAKTEWTVEKLLQKYGSHQFKTDEVDSLAKEKLYVTMSDYVAYARNSSDEDPIYLFDDKYDRREHVSDLLNDYTVPMYFKEDFFELLGDERPPYRWIVFGPPRSGSQFHTDPYRTSAWNALLKGRKRWALYPYQTIPPGVELEWDEDGNFDSDSPDVVKWFLNVYPYLPPDQKPIECIQEEGETIFIPSGWWHQVLNLTETIAVTQNVCNQQNLEAVAAELDWDDEDMFEDLEINMKKHRPEIPFPKTTIKKGFRK